jgi:hypothetical protein
LSIVQTRPRTQGRRRGRRRRKPILPRAATGDKGKYFNYRKIGYWARECRQPKRDKVPVQVNILEVLPEEGDAAFTILEQIARLGQLRTERDFEQARLNLLYQEGIQLAYTLAEARLDSTVAESEASEGESSDSTSTSSSD